MTVGHGIVLGASSGIGRALVAQLALAESNVTALSRRGQVPGLTSTFVSAGTVDIRDYTSIAAAIGEARRRHPIQYVVNCVGVGFYAPIGADYSKIWNDILATNVVGILNLLSVVDTILPELDHLIHVSSMAAHRVSRVPGNLCYSVSKAAARTIVEEHRRALRDAGRHTRISMVSPGFVEETDFIANFFTRGTRVPTADVCAGSRNLKPDDVAGLIMHVLALPPHMEITDILVRPTEQST